MGTLLISRPNLLMEAILIFQLNLLMKSQLKMRNQSMEAILVEMPLIFQSNQLAKTIPICQLNQLMEMPQLMEPPLICQPNQLTEAIPIFKLNQLMVLTPVKKEPISQSLMEMPLIFQSNQLMEIWKEAILICQLKQFLLKLLEIFLSKELIMVLPLNLA